MRVGASITCHQSIESARVQPFISCSPQLLSPTSQSLASPPTRNAHLPPRVPPPPPCLPCSLFHPDHGEEELPDPRRQPAAAAAAVSTTVSGACSTAPPPAAAMWLPPIITLSGKMDVLDRLLIKCHARKRKVREWTSMGHQLHQCCQVRLIRRPCQSVTGWQCECM